MEHPFNIDTAREFHLRKHLRDILLPYVRVHLTLDHVAYTQMVVEELLLQALEYVPLVDATSFLLPTDPFDVLARSLHSLDTTTPEERWATPSEHIDYLRTFFPPPSHPTDLRSEGCWHEDSDDRYTKISRICRPISPPILSRRAIRNTPKLGSASAQTSVPRKRSALAPFLDLGPVSVEEMEDLPTPPIDDVLDLRLKIDSDTTAGIRPFLRSVLGPMREKFTNYLEETPHVPEFLRRDSPPRFPTRLDSPPLFTRIARGSPAYRGVGKMAETGTRNPIRIPDLASLLQLASPETMSSEDGDINGHHMQVVDEWSTLAFSSPPPAPSPHSSDGSEVDELWHLSPPGTPATSLLAAKMDEVEIPRVRKFGHKNTSVDENVNHDGTAGLLSNSPGFFITSFISAPVPITQAAKPITAQLEDEKLGMHSPRPLLPDQYTSNSIVGQPPSIREKRADKNISARPADGVEGFAEQQFDDALASIYASTPQDPLSYIKEEKLDDKEIMLMDVPDLPPPTAHHKDPFLFPERLHTFVTLKGDPGPLDDAQYGSKSCGLMAFLRPVKGIKPLVLDLSWRPFNFGKSIPTDEDMAEIAKPIQPQDELLGYRNDECRGRTDALLGLAIPLTAVADDRALSSVTFPRVCEKFGTSPVPRRAEANEHFEYLLTQRERVRASRPGDLSEVEVEEQDVDIERAVPHGGEHEGVVGRDENPRQDDECLDPPGYRSQGQVDSGYPFDDSGIDIVDDPFGRFSTLEFGVPSFLLCPPEDDAPYVVDSVEANKENADHQIEDKENVPPQGVGNALLADPQSDFPDSQYDWNGYFEFPASQTPPFEPLSFASQGQIVGSSDHFTNSKAQDAPPLTPSARRLQCTEDDFTLPSECGQTDTRAAKRCKLDDLVPTSSTHLLSAFIGLRNQVTSTRTLERSGDRNDAPTPHPTPDVPDQILPRAAPDDVFDPHTVRLPEHWIPAAAVHRYLASMSLIQKRALVCELQGHQCQVALVERYDLGGIDIILDPDYGVLFVPLFALPAHLDSAIDRISRGSWCYSNLLVIFEAFPTAQSRRTDHARHAGIAPYAYTPPICSAVKRLRRNLGIAEGCGTMNPQCALTWAFANDVEEAAKFVRCFGEEACAMSTERGYGMLWDERTWLEEDEREGEVDLARVHGMNAFAAFVMLYDRSLEDIFDLSPEARLADFGHLVGRERVTMLNTTIENRMKQIAPDLADSVIGPEY